MTVFDESHEFTEEQLAEAKLLADSIRGGESAGGTGDAEDVVQVIMLGVVFERYKAWAGAYGLDVTRTQFDPEDIPTYSVVVK